MSSLYNGGNLKGIQKMANDFSNTAKFSSPGVLVSGHYYKSYGYKTIRSEGTCDWLLTYTLKGEGCFEAGNINLSCHTGDIAILKPGTPHYYFTSKGEIWDFMWVHFVPRLDWNPWLQLPEVISGLIYIHMDNTGVKNRISKAFRRVIEDNRQFNTIHRELALSALEEIILLIYQKSNETNNQVRDPRIQEIVEYLYNHYDRQHTVSDLAERVCLSPSRLAHLFKEEVGQSIIDMLIKIRLKHAARLLQFTSHSVSEIAEECGFQSTSYFTQQFSSAYGMSPSVYRRKIANMGR